MILIGKLTSTANTYLVKYICDSVDYPIYYKKQSNAARIIKGGVAFIILDEDRESWVWDIQIPANVEIPTDITIDNYTYNTETKVFTALTSTSASDVTEFTSPVKITYAIGTVLTVAGSASFGGSVSIASYLVVNRAATFNNLISIYANIEATSLGSGSLVVGRTESSTTNRGGLSVFGNAYVGKVLNVLGNILTPTLSVLSDSNNALSVNGGMSIAKTITVNGSATINGNLSVGGTITFLGNATIGASEILLSKDGAVPVNIVHDTSTLLLKSKDSLNNDKVSVYIEVGKDNTYVNIVDGTYSNAYSEFIPGLNILGKDGTLIGICIDSINETSQLISRYKSSLQYTPNNTTLFNIAAYGWSDNDYSISESAYIKVKAVGWSPSESNTEIHFGVGGTSAKDGLVISKDSVIISNNNRFLIFKDLLNNNIKIGCDDTNIFKIVGSDDASEERLLISVEQGKADSTIHLHGAVQCQSMTIVGNITASNIDDSITVNNKIADYTYTKLTIDAALNTTFKNSVAMNDDIKGFNIINNADDINNDITVSSGSIVDTTKEIIIPLSADIVKQLDAEFAVGTNMGMLQAGNIIAASTTYKLFVIYRSGDSTSDIIAVPYDIAIELPADFSYYRYIGSIQTDSDSHIIQCEWIRESRNTLKCYYKTQLIPVVNVEVPISGQSYDIGVIKGVRANVFGYVSAGLAAADSSLAISLYRSTVNEIVPEITASGTLLKGISGDVNNSAGHNTISSYFSIDTDISGSIKLSRSGSYLDENNRTNLQIWGYSEFI